VSAKFLVPWTILIATLSVHGRWSSGVSDDRCAMDGNRIDPVHRVDQALDGEVRASFCSLACAAEWPERPRGAYWQVRDEVGGSVLDSTRAHFVLSRVVAVPARAERIHCFAHWADAQAHVERHGGQAIPDPLAAPAAGEPTR